jgi:dihydrofolate synthase/folylpolyglutamate synthase
LDHTDILGGTVEEIARDKAGIIKADTIVISGASQPSVRKIVADRGRSVGATLWQLGRQICSNVRSVGLAGSRFDLTTPVGAFDDLALAPLGVHQVANASLATAAALGLGEVGLPVGEAHIRRALTEVSVPGRLEIAQESPLLVLDGAHNPAKMTALAQALDALYPGKSIVGILAFKRGHDVAATLRVIAPQLKSAILTRFDATTDYGRGQSLDPSEIESLFSSLGIDLPRHQDPDPTRAVQRALDLAGEQDLVCVTGSLYLVGAVRSWLRARR